MDLLTLLAVVVVAVVYSWTMYNVPILIVGARNFRREKSGKHGRLEVNCSSEDLPSFSLIVPAKNEELVLPRLLRAMMNLNYPKEKVEIIVVEDGSTDDTVGLCGRFVDKSGGLIRLVRTVDSCGKPSALNHGLKFAKGDIVGVFDADSVPEPDVLFSAARYFQDKSVAALQGRTLSVNSDVNMLTKFVSYEDAAWSEGYLRGRDALGLFVHLRGSCQFIRRDVLESVGGWNEKYISEDFEISARLTEKGCRIKYAPDVRSWQEIPQGLRGMFHQRLRWFRGAMEVALTYGRLIRRPSLKTLDAEISLLGPFVMILSLLGYLVGPLAIYRLDGSIVFIITVGGWVLATASIVGGALALLHVAKPKKTRDLLWAPFIYAYWSFQVLLATWALIKIVFRTPKEWKKTVKTGTVTATDALLNVFDSLSE